MFGLVARLIAPTVAVLVASYAIGAAETERRRMEVILSNKCQLCKQMISGQKRRMKCCDVEFHLDCLRAYVQSLNGCPIKCPREDCSEIVVLDRMEARDLEYPIATHLKYYCHDCKSIVNNKKPRVLPCTHRFCVECIKKCLMATVDIMGEQARCPMEACRKRIPNELLQSIRMER